MSWSFVGRLASTLTINGTTTGTITLPAGVHGGDFIVAGFQNTTGGAGTTCTVTGFTALSNQDSGSASANDKLWSGYRVAAGSFGGATTDTTFAVTLGANTWGEFDLLIMRSTVGVGVVTYAPVAKNGTRTSTLVPAVISPTPGAGDLTVYGYGGSNLALSGTELMSTAPTSLSNWPSPAPTLSGNGGVIGMGWGTGVTAPGNAAVTVGTATLATVDQLDFAIGVTEQSSSSSPGALQQPGSNTWRRKHRRKQQWVVPIRLPTAPGTTFNFTPGSAIPGLTSPGIPVSISVPNIHTVNLATGTGTAQSPTVTLTVNAGLATGTGTAQSPKASLTVNAGLATGTGSAQQPSAPRTSGLATGTGTAQPPLDSLTVNAVLATGTGTAQSPGITLTVNAGLATGSGTAFGPAVAAGASNAQLATGTGTAQPPTVTLTVNAGLATGTGSASQPGINFTAGLATGTGTAQPPVTTIAVNASLAHGTGAAQASATSLAVNAGLATGTGTAQTPAVTLAVNAILANGTGTALSPGTGARTAGLATGTGAAQQPSTPRTAGLASAVGVAFNVSIPVRTNVDYTGSTLSNPNTLGGTVGLFTLGGTLSVAANTLGGTASVTSNTLGGTVSVGTLGGTASVTSDTLTGTLSVVVNALAATEVTDKMQEVDIILNEFNDATVTFQILNNGSPDNITGMTVNALFKKTRGDLDSAGTTKTYSSGGGSPAITINTPSTGSCTLAIPDADVVFPNWTFYRIDVVNGSVTTTAIFGTVTITQL